MPNPNLGSYIFYPQYVWQAADFTTLQSWLYDFAAGVAEGLGGPSVLTGFGCVPAGGLNLQVNPGIAYSTGGGVDGFGQLLQIMGAQTVAIPVDPSNSTASLIVLRPTQTGTTFIPEPLNPSINVPLQVAFGTNVVVIAGTPSISPAYPSAQPGDVVVLGVITTPGLTTLTTGNFDRTPINTPRQKIQGITIVSGNYSAASGDLGEDIIEADASALGAGGLMITLPPVLSYAGRYKTIVNVGASNPVSCSGDALISGQAVQTVDDQWGSMKVYSNGIGWRIV